MGPPDYAQRQLAHVTLPDLACHEPKWNERRPVLVVLSSGPAGPTGRSWCHWRRACCFCDVVDGRFDLQFQDVSSREAKARLTVTVTVVG